MSYNLVTTKEVTELMGRRKVEFTSLSEDCQRTAGNVSKPHVLEDMLIESEGEELNIGQLSERPSNPGTKPAVRCKEDPGVQRK